MITRLVKMTFRADETDNFKVIFEENKEKIRNFPGCEYLELLQADNTFFTYSRWQTAEDLEAYRQSELFKSTWKKTKALFGDKPKAWSTNRLHSLK